VPDELSVGDVSYSYCCEVDGRFPDSDIIFLFVIFVRNGKIDILEGFTSHGDWRYDYDNMVLTK